MKIDKHNYEEYFLLYVDNELSAEDRKAVEDFANNNPDYRAELDALLQTQLQVPGALGFDKSLLFKTDTPAIDDMHLVLYIDDELNEAERKKVEAKAEQDEAIANELALLKRTKLSAELVPFENKEVLYRHETKVVRPVFRWGRLLAAASVLLIGGMLWLNRDMVASDTEPDPQVAQGTGAEKTDPITDYSSQEASDKTPEKEIKILASQERPVKKTSTGKEEKNVIAATVTTNAGTENTSDVTSVSVVATEKQVPLAVTAKTIPEVEKTIVGERMETFAAFHNERQPVTPVILSEEDFIREKEEPVTIAANTVAYMDGEENREKKLNGNMRGLLRKASRFINRSTVTESDTEVEEDKSVVRIAGFAIAKK
ncbi:MAG: hypothetical protein KIT80_22605 [Chitinophagaceae bacterium]|nr:hypothetical protein [Chitinophagaceae bacterium]MCW5929728.1 hypothetical protein [Chitinophagaceae bacterium]